MIKVPHKWRGTFIMSSFRWKLDYQLLLTLKLRPRCSLRIISLRSSLKIQGESSNFLFDFFMGEIL